MVLGLMHCVARGGWVVKMGEFCCCLIIGWPPIPLAVAFDDLMYDFTDDSAGNCTKRFSVLCSFSRITALKF